MTTHPAQSRGAVAAALGFARRRGLHAALAAAAQHARARWDLRGATHVGTVRLQGRARVSNAGLLIIEDRVRLAGAPVRVELTCDRGARLRVGEGTFINYGSDISATDHVDIGRHCDIGQYAIIIDNDYHDADDHTRRSPGRPVILEDDVWLGARVIVLPGTHIGRGAVIGAHSVVRGDVPAYTLAAGVPARVIRQLGSADG